MTKQLNPFSLRPLLGVAALTLLVACNTSPSLPESPNAGRYSIDQDRGPNRAVEIAEIPEVIPVTVNRTMAGNRSPYSVLGETYQVMATEEGYSAVGVASWYGEKFHGHKTSNGEVFDMYLASAAHKSLPIPSFLRVTNLDNNRSIVVRVNDRGPFHGDRLIDLSYAAALKLDYADRGTARVQLDAIVVDGRYQDRTINDSAASIDREPLNSVAQTALAPQTFLQVGAFADLGRAEELSKQLRQLTSKPVVIRTINGSNNSLMHRVRVGPVLDAGEIQQITQSVVAANLGSPYTVTE